MYKALYIDNIDGIQTAYIWDDKEGLVTLPMSEFNYAYQASTAGKYITMSGVRVNKVKRFTRNGPGMFESDVPRETRVLTDLYLEDDTPSEGHTTLFFDIEVSMEKGVPDTLRAQNKITSIAAYDSTTEKYVVFVLNSTARGNSTYTKGEATVEVFDDEQDLLNSFMNYYEGVSPTILTGWNSNGFDIPYLYNRLVNICGEATACRLSPIGKVKYSEFRQQWIIAGVSCLDYFGMYKKFNTDPRPNYRLDTIGRIEVGMGKVEYEGSLDSLYEQDPDKFIEYNLMDVKIVVALDKELGYIELARGICHMGHVPYEDYAYSSRFLEGTILTYLHRKGIVATDKPEGGREMMDKLKENDEQGFEGAFVKTPMSGLYEWVYSLDLQSLYPSIIMSLNISPETKIGKILNWSPERFKDDSSIFDIVENKNPPYKVTKKELEQMIQSEMLSISSNGIIYTNVKRGVIPEVLEAWFSQRKEYQALMKKYAEDGDMRTSAFYKRRQHIQKIFLNSLYGVLGLPIFRFYDVDNALAVTASGQDVIKNSAWYVNNLYSSRNIPEKSDEWVEKYWNVLKQEAKKKKEPTPDIPSARDYCIYIDTDSLYFSAADLFTTHTTDEEKKNFTIKLARAIESKLNAFYDTFAEEYFFCKKHRLYIKGESIAKTGIWIAKKKYVLDKIYDLEKGKDDNEVKVTGLDTKRSSFPPSFKKFMEKFMCDVLRKTEKSVIDASVLDFKNSVSDIPLMDIARNTSVKEINKHLDSTTHIISKFKKGTPINVKAAITYNNLIKYYNLQDKIEPITEGSKIKYVLLRDNPFKIESVAIKGYNDPKEILDLINEYIDYDALFEKELSKKIENFYDAMSWGNIPTNINTSMSEWFSF